MAEEPEADRNPSGIARVGKRKWGYDPSQVNEFLDRAHALYESEGVQLSQKDIQNVSFDLCKGGYVIAQVDAALTRLERAVTDKTTAWEISQHGRVTWKATTMGLFRTIAAHAARPERERFSAGQSKQPSYDRRQVDRLIDQIIAKSSAALGVGDARDDAQEVARKLVDLNASVVANVVFTQRRGARGYDERQVDYYLNSCVELLSRIESYERLSDYSADPSAELSAMSEEGAQTEVISPIPLDASADSQSAVGSLFDLMQKPAPIHTHRDAERTTEDQSFDALNNAEREIFQSESVSPTAMPEPQFVSQRRSDSDPEIPPVPLPTDSPSVDSTHSTASSTLGNDAWTTRPAPTSASRTVPRSEPVTPAHVEPSARTAAPARTATPAHSGATGATAEPARATSAPSPRQSGSQSTVGAGSSGDSSLAALAHLAEETHSEEKPADLSFDVQIPQLAMPHVTWASTPDSSSPSHGGVKAPSAATSPASSTSDAGSFGIPDLSFPVFDEGKRSESDPDADSGPRVFGPVRDDADPRDGSGVDSSDNDGEYDGDDYGKGRKADR